MVPVGMIAGMMADLFGGAAAAADGLDVSIDARVDLSPLAAMKGRARVAVIIGCNRAAKPVKAGVVASAESIARYGFLAKSIGTKTRFYPGGSSFVTVIGPKRSFARTKKKKKIRPNKYALVLTKDGETDFIRPTAEAHGRTFAAAVGREVYAELARAAGK